MSIWREYKKKILSEEIFVYSFPLEKEILAHKLDDDGLSKTKPLIGRKLRLVTTKTTKRLDAPFFLGGIQVTGGVYYFDVSMEESDSGTCVVTLVYRMNEIAKFVVTFFGVILVLFILFLIAALIIASVGVGLGHSVVYKLFMASMAGCGIAIVSLGMIRLYQFWEKPHKIFIHKKMLLLGGMTRHVAR